MEVCREEAEHKWLEAAKFYEQVLESGRLSQLLAAEYWRKIGFCYDLASRQTGDLEDFKKLRQLAVEDYRKAAALFGAISDLEDQGKRSLCLALSEFARSWISPNSTEKQKALDKCNDLSKEALEVFKNYGNMVEYGNTANLLCQCLFDRLYVAGTGEDVKAISKEAIEIADAALATCSQLEHKDVLLLSFSWASLHAWFAANISDQEKEAQVFSQNCISCSEKALRLCKQVQNPYLQMMALWAGTFSALFFTEDITSSLALAKEMREKAGITGDNYFKGIAGYLLAFVSDWMVPNEANPDNKKEKLKEILNYAEEAIHCLQLTNQDAHASETCLFYTESYSCIARECTTVVSEKVGFLNNAIETGRKGLDFAVRSGSQDALAANLHALSKAYHYYSKLQTGMDEKQKQLQNALDLRKEYIRIVQKIYVANAWILGVGLVYAGQIEADLAKLEKRDAKLALLQAAISDMNEGVSRCKDWIECRAVPSLVASVAEFEDTFAEMLYHDYTLTSKKENLKKANDLCRNAAEGFKKVDLPSRVAESYWKMAKNFDLIGEYSQAAENFENSFAGYKAAAQKSSHFSDFYLDYASYMKAWSEIENAKNEHHNEKYAIAMNYYEKASNLLKQSKSWNYLSSNFHAWSLLEQAEDLSRGDNCKESIIFFQKAMEFLKESARILRIELNRIDKTDEQNLVKSLIQASNNRIEYGNGRIAIEEAKILDKEGNHGTSSQKYEFAAETFRKIVQTDPEQMGKEVNSLIYLCQAWQKMALAEAKSSPIMYEEAADLFALANEHSNTESTGMLALGHSSFCKALEAETEYEITRSTSMYDQISKHINSAANYYLRAGFESASNYAQATQRLFDAYVYMDSAKREKDLEKQAKYYLMAEKVLLISGECFAQSGHVGKNEQVQRLLRKVREEKELALSLSEVLHVSPILSSTSSFSTIGPTEEKAVGLERFRHADIQVKLIQHEKETKIGENVNLEIQFANVGKEAVLITNVQNILPPGFQVVTKPEYCSIEGSSLSMNGKRIAPLATDEIRLTLKSFLRGSIEIEPKIVCADETGKKMTFNPEPIIFNFLEAAIPGRVSTGYDPLDNLLFGGIPENYAVILTSPSCNEKEELIKKFLQAGINHGQITFYVTEELGNAKTMQAEKQQSNIYLFMCNPRADIIAQGAPNIFKLKGVENLTDIEIALTKAFRTLTTARNEPRRACIEIVSDVLLQHHAIVTRKWLSGLLADLKSNGFTTLAVMNPQMHMQEEVQAILGVFEGEIRIFERENGKGLEKILRVRKMYNQKYIETDLILTREKLENE